MIITNDLINKLYEMFDAAYEHNMYGNGTDITRMVTTYIPAVIQNIQAKDYEVAYICNRKKCEVCDSENPCYHTTDIRFAANFKEVEPGKWMEVEEGEI